MESTAIYSANALGIPLNVRGQVQVPGGSREWNLVKLHITQNHAERFRRLTLRPGEDYSTRRVGFKPKLRTTPLRTSKGNRKSKYTVFNDQHKDVVEHDDYKGRYDRYVEDMDLPLTEEKPPTPSPSPPAPTPPPQPPTPPPPPPKTPTLIPEEEDEGDVSIVDLPVQEELISPPSPVMPTTPQKMPLAAASPVWGDPEEAPIEETPKEIHDESPWKRILVGFTQDTTLHGIRFTTTSSQFRSRRWLWTVVLLASFSVFVYYVTDRLTEFLQYKKTVNVQVDYISHVYFPSVTICNENAFRLSAAANGRWYNQVERILEISQGPVQQPCGNGEFTCDDSSCIPGSFQCDSFPDCLNSEDELGCNMTAVVVEESRLLLGQNASDNTITLEAMFNNGSHDLGDLIMNCVWKGKPCNVSDTFVKTFTDMGVCYRFAKADAKITQSGPGYGLSLTINIEQYDYTKNPETGVGIKVLLNNHWDVPMMGDKAFAISPGLYSLVAIEKTDVENLEPPWGVCGESELKYYSNYSVSACNLDCENRYVRTQCHCRDLHMPPASDNVGVCQVGAYMNCARPKLEEMRTVGNFCTCPTPCTDTNLVPSLSFSSISVDTDAGGAAQQKRVESLTAKLAEAREIRYRLAKDKYRQTIRMFFDIDKSLSTIIGYINSKSSTFYYEKEWLSTIKVLMEQDCVQFTATQTSIMQSIKSASSDAVERYTDYLLDFLLVPTESLKRVFVEADRVLGNVSTPENHSPYNQTIYTKLHDILTYIDIGMVEGLERLTQGVNSTMYMFGEYGYTSELLIPVLSMSRVNCSWCLTSGIQKPLMELLATKLLDAIETTVLPSMEEVKKQVTTLMYEYGNRTVLFNETTECEVTTESGFTTESTTTSIAITTQQPVTCYTQMVALEWEVVKNITQELETNITSMVSLMDTSMEQVVIEAWSMVEELQRHLGPKCESELSKLFDEYTDIYVKLSNTLSDANSRYTNFRSDLSSYKTEYIKMNLSLSEISSLARFEFQKNFISSQTISLGSLLDSRFAALSSLRRQINTISYHILSQVTLEHLINSSRVWNYFGVNETSKVQPSDSVCDELGCYVEPALVATAWYNPLVSLKGEVTTAQNTLLEAVMNTETYLDNYLAGNVVDDAFYKKNFLQLDLFFKELTRKSVSQQKAYEYPALLSELGGLLGLLLGASVLTVMELIDMLIYNGIIKCVVNYKERHEKRKEENNTAPQNGTVSNGTTDNKRNHVVPLEKV